MEQRTNRLQVLLSEDERARLDKVAYERGMKPSVFARTKILEALGRGGKEGQNDG